MDEQRYTTVSSALVYLTCARKPDQPHGEHDLLPATYPFGN
jgi:hypothetical protein